MMQLIRTPALLLRKRDYSDTSLIVTFFTRDLGKLQFIIKGAKSKARHFVHAFEHGLTYEITFMHRQGHKGLTFLRDAHILEGQVRRHSSYEKMCAVSYAMELTDLFTELEDPDPDLFEGIREIIQQIGSSSSLTSVLRRLEAVILHCSGYLRDLGHCKLCKMNLENHSFVLEQTHAGIYCGECKPVTGKKFKEKDLVYIQEIRNPRYELPDQASRRIRDLLWFYIDFHLEKPIKSRKFIEAFV